MYYYCPTCKLELHESVVRYKKEYRSVYGIYECMVCKTKLQPKNTPEEIQDIKNWMPSKEQAEEFFKQFPVD